METLTIASYAKEKPGEDERPYRPRITSCTSGRCRRGRGRCGHLARRGRGLGACSCPGHHFRQWRTAVQEEAFNPAQR